MFIVNDNDTLYYGETVVQWSSSKADTIGTNKNCLLQREGVFWSLVYYVAYIWDSVSVHYRGVSSKRGSTLLPFASP